MWQESLHERGQADHAAECRALFAYQRRRKQDRWQFLAFPLLPFFPSLCASRVKSSAAGAAWRQLSRQQRCRFDGSLLCCAISCTFATPCNHVLLHCTFVLFAKNFQSCNLYHIVVHFAYLCSALLKLGVMKIFATNYFAIFGKALLCSSQVLGLALLWNCQPLFTIAAFTT